MMRLRKSLGRIPTSSISMANIPKNTTLFPSLPNDPRLPEKLKNALGANDFY